MNHVLVIDDDLASRNLVGDLLTDEGFEVTAAGGMEGRGLLDVMRTNCVVVATTLTDGRAGALDLVRDIRERDPRVGIVVIANGDIDLVDKEVSGLDVWAVVEKPGDLEKVPCKVRTACEFSAIPLDTKTKMAEDLQAEVAHFRNVKRSTGKIRTRKTRSGEAPAED